MQSVATGTKQPACYMLRTLECGVIPAITDPSPVMEQPSGSPVPLPKDLGGQSAKGHPSILQRTKFPNCPCGISTRQLELLFWRAGPIAQHSQDCPIFFIQLNYVHKTKQNKVLPPYVKLPCTKVAPGIPLPLPRNQ